MEKLSVSLKRYSAKNTYFYLLLLALLSCGFATFDSSQTIGILLEPTQKDDYTTAFCIDSRTTLCSGFKFDLFSTPRAPGQLRISSVPDITEHKHGPFWNLKHGTLPSKSSEEYHTVLDYSRTARTTRTSFKHTPNPLQLQPSPLPWKLLYNNSIFNYWDALASVLSLFLCVCGGRHKTGRDLPKSTTVYFTFVLVCLLINLTAAQNYTFDETTPEDLITVTVTEEGILTTTPEYTTKSVTSDQPGCTPPLQCDYTVGWTFTSDMSVLAGLNYTDELGTSGSCLFNKTSSEFTTSLITIWNETQQFLNTSYRCCLVSSFSQEKNASGVFVSHSVIVSNSSHFEPIEIEHAFRHGLNVTGELEQYELDENSFEFFKEYDECDAGDDNCTQICTDTRKAYNCSCESGFELQEDGYTCLGIPTTTPEYTTESVTSDQPGCTPPLQCDYLVGWTFTSDMSVLAGLQYTDELGTSGSCLFNETSSEFTTSFIAIWEAAQEFLDKSFRCCVVSSFSQEKNASGVFVSHSVIVSSSYDFEPIEIEKAFRHGLNVTGELEQYELDENSFEFFKEYDECDAGDDKCTQICTDTRKAYNCSCESGFELQEDGYTCRVIDPCNLLCTNGECFVNIEGIPQCQCDVGFELGPGSDTLCIDINDCSNEEINKCQQICENTIGSYICHCRSGYELGPDRHTCGDINECLEELNECTQICRNTEGGYDCECEPGYETNPQNRYECIEINECRSEPCFYGECEDLLNDYNCMCFPGYTGRNCEADINECKPNPCLNGNCKEHVNGYECFCDMGWTGSNCDEDINECANHQDKCQHICVNVNRNVDNKGYVCECRSGYQLHPDGKQCREIDECASDPCQNGGRCVDYLDKYVCNCGQTGYEGINCEIDIDECRKDPCDINANCTNTDGSFYCTCKENYRGDGAVKCYEIIFFPFGEENGDLSLRDNYDQQATKYKTDRVSKTIKPSSGFPFWGDFYYSLYFSDNGVIVFSKEQEEKFAYPTPPKKGFPAKPPVPMVAAFWQDGDTSYQHSGHEDKGNVFYQVYDQPINRQQAPIFEEANRRIHEYSDNPIGTAFAANWILVVTWFEIPAVPAKNRYQNPNTFQQVLVTDGIYSFGILNFREDAMLWKYWLLKNPDVIYGYSSGDGQHYVNAQEEFTTTKQRYGPDQELGNIDKHGQWIFRLENNDENTVNYKRRCLDWVQRRDYWWWSWGLGTCPCWLGQAWFDFRYSWVNRPSLSFLRWYAAWRNEDIAELDEQILTEIYSLPYNWNCLQLRWSNWWGAGQHCCYRWDGSLVRGYEGVWSQSYRHIEHFRYSGFWSFNWNQHKKYLFNDVYPRYYCCDRSNDQSFCDLYEEKRPSGSCRGYRRPGWGWFWGDPHITTLDGLGYTFNGLGEYTLLNVNNSMAVIQGRTKQVIDKATNETQSATVFDAFALQATNSSRIQYNLWEEGGDFDLYIDGKLVNKTDLSEGYYEDVLVNVQLEEITDDNGNNRTVTTFTSGVSISVAAIDQLLDISVSAPDDFKNSTLGLMGVWNDDPCDDTTFPNGTKLPAETCGNATDKEYFEFGESWRVNQDDSLFLYTDVASWELANIHENYVPIFLDDLLNEYKDDPFLDTAKDTCGVDEKCLYDTLATYDVDFGLTSLASSEQFQQQENQLANYPPNITAEGVTNGTLILNVRIGELQQVQVYADDANNDPITFSLTEDVPNASIDDTGLFSWTPSSLDVVRIGLAASDNLTSSVLVAEVHICDCKNGGVCAFDVNVNSSIEDNFYITGCECDLAYAGTFCEDDYDGCTDIPCYQSVLCTDVMAPEYGFTCGPCPPGSGLTGDGIKCFDYDECQNGQEEGGDPICNQICENTLGSYLCSCYDEGYRLQADGITCEDIDECEEKTYICPENANCNNTVGAYGCYCQPGFSEELLLNQTVCIDINECVEDSPCDINANCNNTEGSFTCTCDLGFEGNGRSGSCIDIDECGRNPDLCGKHADCNNTLGSYVCVCSPGWEGDGFECTNENECTVPSHTCNRHANCTDSIGSFFCTCREGYIGDGYECKNENECLSKPCEETIETCVDTEGSFNCICAEGYTRNEAISICEDVNECDTGANQCDLNADCTNIIGSYTCTCQDNFIGDGFTCYDIDECSSGANVCPTNTSYCTNTAGSYLCDCKGGYTGDGINCTDINECGLGLDECKHSALCINAIPGYTCSCGQGLMPMPNGFECTDIDECASLIDDCPQYCNNTFGGYNCSCYEGYSFNEITRECDLTGPCSLICINSVCIPDSIESCQCLRGFKQLNSTYCQDVDECLEGLDLCNQNCLNTNGGYDCSCVSGYRLDDEDRRTCTDINECEEDPNTCPDPNSSCVNQLGYAECICDTGFHLNDSLCIDFDECTNGTYDCDINAECTNTIGGYTCICNPGFIQNGADCIDMNECLAGDDNCSPNAECTNTVGSYTCACNNGYEGDGITCIDMDECNLGSDDCDINAECTNADGSYTCQCKNGYNGNGYLCADTNECKDISGTADDCNVNAVCVNTPGSYDCSCNSGYIGDGFTDCSDINECDSLPCVDNTDCTNTNGSYACTCKDGFRGDGYENGMCTDINECEENDANCHGNAYCENTDGSYACICDEGYMGDGENCSDINECATDDICHMWAQCVNTDGSYWCTCQEGFVGDGLDCYDVDECEHGNDNCAGLEFGGVCNNTIGSYKCSCREGFTGNGTVCNDINECIVGSETCTNKEVCVNQFGDVTCQCEKGYYRDSVAGTCQGGETFVVSVVFTYFNGFSYVEYLEEPPQGEVRDYGVYDTLGITITTEILQRNLTSIYKGSPATNVGNVTTDFTTLQVTEYRINSTSANINEGAIAFFSVNFIPGSNVTMHDVAAAFLDGLTGPAKNHIGDSIVLPDTVEVSGYERPPITTPIVETTPVTPEPPQVCETDSDCDNWLNITKCDGNICVCKQGFTKSKTDEADTACHPTLPFKVVLEILKFGEEEAVWNPDLNDRSSQLFKEYRSQLCNEMSKLNFADEDPDTYPTCDVIKFTEGSVVADFQMMMSPNTGLGAVDIASIIQSGIDDGVLDGITIQDGTLNVTPLNECEEDLDDCDENAVCTDTDIAIGYECKCEKNYIDENKPMPGFLCAVAPTNKLAIILGTLSGVLLLILILVIVFYMLYRQGYLSGKSSTKSRAKSLSSRSSSAQDVSQSQEGIDLGHDSLMGVSNDNLSTIGSDGKPLTESEKERIYHITKVMRMPGMNDELRARALSTGNDPDQFILPNVVASGSESYKRSIKSAPAGNVDNFLSSEDSAPNGRQIQQPDQQVVQGKFGGRDGQSRDAPDRVMSLPCMHEDGEGVTLNLGYRFTRETDVPERRSPDDTKGHQEQSRDLPSPNLQRFEIEAPPHNSPDRVTSLPTTQDTDDDSTESDCV